MKTFILENIYMSDMSAPSVCSTDRFPTFESAMEEAHKQFKEEAKTYRKSYGADNITTEDAIKKVQKALDANDAGTAMQLGENLSCALRDGSYQVTNAVEVDE